MVGPMPHALCSVCHAEPEQKHMCPYEGQPTIADFNQNVWILETPPSSKPSPARAASRQEKKQREAGAKLRKSQAWAEPEPAIRKDPKAVEKEAKCNKAEKDKDRLGDKLKVESEKAVEEDEVAQLAREQRVPPSTPPGLGLRMGDVDLTSGTIDPLGYYPPAG